MFGWYDKKKNEAKYNDSIGKLIRNVAIEGESTLKFLFLDGSEMSVSDEGQSCCEYRYMNSDDDLSYYRGSIFRGFEIRDGNTEGDTDSQFLLVNTDKGTFTVANYNSHNGYYGGFSIVVR